MGFAVGSGLVALAAIVLGLARMAMPSERFTSTCSMSVIAIGMMLMLAAVKIGTTSSFARSVLPAPQLASVDLGPTIRGPDGRFAVRADVVHDAGLKVIPGLAEGVRQVRDRLVTERAGARPRSMRIGFRLTHAHAHGPENGTVATLEYDTSDLLYRGRGVSDAELFALARGTSLNGRYAAGIELLAEECAARTDAMRGTLLCREALAR